MNTPKRFTPPRNHQSLSGIGKRSPLSGDQNSKGSNSSFYESVTSERTEPFDICFDKTVESGFALKPSLLVKNRERRREMMKSVDEQKISVLRPGMILLQNFLSIPQQVDVVRLCRNLGKGSGGFYQPKFQNGAKMNLQMMCLGKNWDPNSSEYGDFRPFDGAKLPDIPTELIPLVDKAIKDSHAFLDKEFGGTSEDHILPGMSPDICVVNFYSKSGRLGLHQDKDESQVSLRKGLPVVSFSIGDSGVFLYGDDRDVKKADEVILNSGDVLIFGGKARHVFHGISCIKAGTAPSTLLEETNLRPGFLLKPFGRRKAERVNHAGEAGHMLVQLAVGQNFACALALHLGFLLLENQNLQEHNGTAIM